MLNKLKIALVCILFGFLAFLLHLKVHNVDLGIWGGPSPTTTREYWSVLVPDHLKEHKAFEYASYRPKLPNVLIYGDSISYPYTITLRDQFQGQANIFRIHRNGRRGQDFIPNMRQFAELFNERLKDAWSFDFDVIHVNVGLHDMKRNFINGDFDLSKESKTPINEYVEQVKNILVFLEDKYPNARLIFATTTAVPQRAKAVKFSDPEKYNTALKKVLEGFPLVSVNDLYSVTSDNIETLAKDPTDIHLNEEGNRRVAEKVEQAIRKLL